MVIIAVWPGASRVMQVIHHLDALPALSGTVVTVGNFDGLHVGHQKILDTLRSYGRRLGLSVGAITFEPHPLRQIAPERAPVRLSTPGQRIRLLERQGVDVLLIQQFDRAFSRLSPEEFIARYLVGGFGARLVCVGHNFRFGHEHRGSVETLRAGSFPFSVVEVPPVLRGGRPVSSSRVRESLREGDVSLARRLLGRCYEIEGSQVSGTGRGSRETVPTLNMKPHNELMPRDGVYCTRIRLRAAEGMKNCPWLDAVTNIGTRPTFNGAARTVETFVPDQEIGSVREAVALRFFRRIREERRFSSSAELRAQILRDVEASRRFFRRLSFIPTDRVEVSDLGDAP